MSSAYLKILKSSRKRELADYQRRKSQLETIRENYSAFDDYASDVNEYILRAADNGQDGIQISNGANTSRAALGGLDGGSGDSDLSSSRSYINAEITRVQNKIDELNKDIKRLSSQISDAEREEKEKAKENQ